MTSIPEISARGSLILWAKFQIPVGPRSGREGEKCRPLDHIRQIPYVHPALFLSYTGIIFCIYAKDFHRFHPYGNHIASWYNVDCHLRMRSCSITYSGASLLGVLRNEISKILKMNLNCLNEYWICYKKENINAVCCWTPFLASFRLTQLNGEKIKKVEMLVLH